MTTDTAIPESDFAARLAAKAARDAEAEANSQVSNFIPLADRALVKRITLPEEQKIGSILVPVAAREKPLEADVIAVGPGRLENGIRTPVAFRAGDRILVGKYAGSEITLDNVDYLLINEGEAFGVIRQASAKSSAV